MSDIYAIAAAHDSARFEDRYLKQMNCPHPHLDEAQTQQGDCACGCRDYRWCPDCDESVEYGEHKSLDAYKTEPMQAPAIMDAMEGE